MADMVLEEKIRILASGELITSELLVQRLGIQMPSAFNLLSQWHARGLIRKIAHGSFVTNHAPIDQQMMSIEALKRRADQFVFTGISAFEFFGYGTGKSEQFHVAIPAYPSGRPRSAINGIRLYHTAPSEFHQMSKAAEEIATPFGSHRVNSIVGVYLSWMRSDCLIDMPKPERINWQKLHEDRGGICSFLQAKIRQYFVEFRNVKDINVEQLYTMIYVDRLKQAIPGSAEPYEAEDTSIDTTTPSS